MNLWQCSDKKCWFSELYDYFQSPDKCPKCGGSNYKITYDYQGERSHNEDHPRWSMGMGCNKEEIPLFQKLYPGSEYNPDTGDLLIKNRSHKKYEMKRRGINEF